MSAKVYWQQKEKKISRLLPLGWLCRGAEDFSTQCHFLHISKNVLLTEGCVLGLLCQWHIAQLVCEGTEFLGIENERIFINLFPVISYASLPECFLF